MRRTALFAVLVLWPLAMSEARASYDPLGGGATRIVFDEAFLGFLERGDVQLLARAPAERRGASIVLPVSGGHLDPGLGKGEIEQDGAFVLRSSRRSLPFRKLVTKTTRSPLVAKVGGSQLKVATAAGISAKRSGFSATFQARGLRLTAKAATRLNKKLRPQVPFAAGQKIGTVTSAPRPLVVTILPAGRSTLTFDAAFMSKLNDHFVSVNPIFPAEHEGPTFTLPIIAKGALAPSGALGTLRTGGEIEFLQLGAGQIFWHELWFDIGQSTALAEVDIEPAPPFPGKLGQVPVLGIGGAALTSDPKARTIALPWAALSLTASTAAAFNEAFAQGHEDFKPGETVGTLSFAAQGQ